MEEKEKVGILTFQSSDNYGALLQAYGTYFIVKKFGYNSEIINYISPHKVSLYKPLDLRFSKNIRSNLNSLLSFPMKSSKKRKSDYFRKFILKLNLNHLNSFTDLASVEKDYYKIIVGSDQVWNYKNTNFDKRYFLDFVQEPTRKISYAASFALSVLEEEVKDEYAALLSDFGYLSVRETTGQRIIKELINYDAKQTLDPTLLLTKEEWELQASSEKNIKDCYLVVYAVGNNDHTLKVAKEIAKNEGLKIILIPTIWQDYLTKVSKYIPTILEYVNLIKNSQYVVTSSFHGLAFAINLNKKFTCCLDVDGKFNSRQLSLLEMTGLKDRLCYSNEIKNQFHIKIDWKVPNDKLNIERQSSLDFLKNALEG